MQSPSNLKCIWTNAYLIELFDLCSKSFDMPGGSKRHGFSILVLRETLVLQRICPKHVCVCMRMQWTGGWTCAFVSHRSKTCTLSRPAQRLASQATKRDTGINCSCVCDCMCKYLHAFMSDSKLCCLRFANTWFPLSSLSSPLLVKECAGRSHHAYSWDSHSPTVHQATKLWWIKLPAVSK